MIRNYALFLGCYIPSMQPFAEASLRRIAPLLKIKLIDMEGATCCPVPEIVRLADHDTWLYVSARNLALAECLGEDILALCNGCWETLYEVREAIANDPELLMEVNSHLSLIDKSVEGKVKVKHFLEVIVEDVGLQLLKASIKKPLSKLKVGIQYGCKLYKSPASKFISYFDDIIETLGVKVIEYGAEKLCCGFPLSLYSMDEAMEERAKFKLAKMQEAKVDCMVTVCPGCFDVLEKAQLLLKRQGLHYDIPMLTLTELMALSLGFRPQEIGVDKHRVKTDAL
ncbi:MAG: CoB--CoM heterodisulfide reductase iron-sulfur subunit B family protein, partial [Promethearchaeota archaeon]